MLEKQSNYLSYLLRLWRDSETGPWRASLESTGHAEIKTFPSLEALFAFLKAQLGEVEDQNEHSQENTA